MFNTIITHENPDLDAIFCCYLLTKYGELKYPGISQAKIVFYPAGKLPDDKSSEELEKDGILAVDIGGGRFDTHPEGNQVEDWKLSHSASSLLATDLGLIDSPEFSTFIQFCRKHDSEGRSLSSKNPLDHLISLPNLIRGGTVLYGGDYNALISLYSEGIHAIITANRYPDSERYREAVSNPWKCYIRGNNIILPDPPDLTALLCAYMFLSLSKERYPDLKVVFDSMDHISQGCTRAMEAALFLGCEKKYEIQKLMAFVDKLRPNAFLLDSDDPLDITVSLPHILKGALILYEKEPLKTLKLFFSLFDSIVAYEREWLKALDEYEEKRRIIDTGKLRLVVIRSPIGAVMKVARWKEKPDIILYQEEKSGNVSVTINKLGKMRNRSLKKLVARLRIAEAITLGEVLDIKSIEDPGELYHWFLHQSERLLAHGSPKAPRPPSSLSLETIVQLVRNEMDPNTKVPEPFCPKDECYQKRCLFYSLRIPNCFYHRKQLSLSSGDEEKVTL